MYKQFVTYEAQYDNHDHQLCVFPPHCTLYERAIKTRLYAYPPRRYLQLRAPLLECECLLVQVISLVDKQFDTFTSLKNTLCSLVIKDSTLNVFQCPCVPILCTITSLTCSISPWTCLSLSEFGLFEKYSYTLHVNANALFFFYSIRSDPSRYHLLGNHARKFVQPIRRRMQCSLLRVRSKELVLEIL